MDVAIGTDNRVASFTLNPAFYGTNQDKRTETAFLGSLEYEKNVNDFSVRAGIWGEINKRKRNQVSSQTAGGFIVPNVYNVSFVIGCRRRNQISIWTASSTPD